MKKYEEVALAGKDIRTFAATCSKVGKWPMEPILASSLDLVLDDEAAVIKESDIIQCRNRVRSGACCVHIGDHQQLPPLQMASLEASLASLEAANGSSCGN